MSIHGQDPRSAEEQLAAAQRDIQRAIGLQNPAFVARQFANVPRIWLDDAVYAEFKRRCVDDQTERQRIRRKLLHEQKEQQRLLREQQEQQS